MEEEEETRGKNKLEIDEKKFQHKKFYLASISLRTLTYSLTNIGKNQKLKSEDQDFFDTKDRQTLVICIHSSI